MDTTATSFPFPDLTPILDRHATRRLSGIPTISLLVGPIGAGQRAWRRWSTQAGRRLVIAKEDCLPYASWVKVIAEQIDLPVAAVHALARRANREPEEFLAAWRNKSPSDRERYWNTLVPEENDDLLRVLAAFGVELSSSKWIPCLGTLEERIIALIVRLTPSAIWPAILFLARSTKELTTLAPEIANWAIRVPALAIAIAVSGAVWDEYLAGASDSRVKALLREGEILIPALDPATVEQSLLAARAGEVTARAAAMLTQNGADPALVGAAVALAQATAVAPPSEVEDSRARSYAEQFLFEFLESLPETAGRFELNTSLNFRFGPRQAEVDLLCREPLIALEVDGYFHFRDAAGYRRDRAKDYELQRRGFLVLRFLADDVIPHLEMIRDRILDALSRTPSGGFP